MKPKDDELNKLDKTYKKNCILSKLTNINQFINKILNYIKTILIKFYKLPIRFFIYYLLLLCGIEMNLSNYQRFPWANLHQFNLSIISLICFLMLKAFHFSIKKLYKESKKNGSNLYLIFFWILKVSTSPINIFLPIFPVLYFIKKIVILKYISMSAIGFYAIFMSSFTYYIALICYFQLVITIIGLYKISKIKYNNLPFIIPNYIIEIPDWINTIKKIYQKGQYAFFSVGIIFTIEYILLIPKDTQILNKSGKINTNISFDFWYTWIIIFIFIVIAFPIIWLFLKKIMTIICVNLQKKASAEISKQFNYNITNPILIFAQYQLNNIAINYKYWFFNKKNIFPGIATCLSFFLNIIKLFDILGIQFYWFTQ